MQKWLADEKARDQIVIRGGPSTGIYWNDARQLKAEAVCQNEVVISLAFTCCHRF